MLNQVNMIGNLTRDPELRYLPSGQAVADITVALNHKYKTDAGEAKEEVNFIDCVAFAKTAENLAEYLHKGSKVFVTGRLKQDRWETEDGQKRSKIKVVLNQVVFLDGKVKNQPPDLTAGEFNRGE